MFMSDSMTCLNMSFEIVKISPATVAYFWRLAGAIFSPHHFYTLFTGGSTINYTFTLLFFNKISLIGLQMCSSTAAKQ